jgi:hypothetical protein
MASNSVIILTHIHEGGPTVNGPIRVDSNISPANPVPTSFGAATYTRSGLTATPAIAQAIIDNPGGFYFNVHTALSPQGVARGQLVRQQQTTPGIGAPTLSEWGAVLMTLLIIAACVFFMLGRARTATALAGNDVSAPRADSVRAIDWKLLAEVAVFTEAVIAIALVALSAGAVDVMGALASGLVAAFIIYLFIANMRRRS